MNTTILSGNAADEGERRGWFLGHFVDDPAGLRATLEVEARWGTHPAGEEKPSWTLNAEATTVSILVRGRFRIRFPAGDVLLSKEGDYALWAPGVPHHWIAEEDSVVLTIRWPSRPGDSRALESPQAAAG